MKITLLFTHLSILLVTLLTLYYSENQIHSSLITNKLIPYRQGHKWGYCDANRKIIIACKYDQAGLFYEGMAAVGVNGKMGYIDQTGKLIIPYKYVIAGNFNQHGTAMVWNGNSEPV